MEATAPQNDKNWKPPHPRQSPLSKSPSNSENYDRSRMDARRDLFGFGYIKPSASASASEDPRAERNNSESRTPTQAPSEEQAFTTPPKITHEEIKKRVDTAKKRTSTLTLFSRANTTYGLNSIIQQLAELMPLQIFARGLISTSKDRESKYSTISAYVEHLQLHRPQLITDILAISSSSGKACHDLVEQVYSTLSGQASDTLECVIINIILYVLGTHEASSRKSTVLAAVQDFVIGNESQREDLYDATKTGKILHLPLPVSQGSALRNLPGYVTLNPDLNPDGFEFAWQTLFVLVIDLLAFEECSKTNIGALERALQLFQVPAHSTSPHELRQRADETTTDWASRVTVHLRWTKAACVEAGCPDRAPTDTALKLLAFSCISPPILDVAAQIMRDEDIEVTSFQKTLEVMHRAERRMTKQDPQLTMILAMRQLPPPILHLGADPPRSASVPAAAPVPPPATSSPSNEEVPIDEHPEFLALQAKLVGAKEPRETVVMNNHTYYKLPQDFPTISKTLRERLQLDQRCNNCGDSHPLIPTHKWKECPFAPHPKRKDYVYPSYHAPIAFTFEPSTVIPVARGTPPPTLASYHAQFSQLYGSDPSSEHKVYSF